MKNKKYVMLVKIMALTATANALVMTIFEVAKQLIHSSLTLWESHIVTIAFTTALSAILTLFALKKQYSLVKLLSGFIPICAWCKRIRDENGEWVSMSTYFESHSNVEITHGICPDCTITLKENLKKSKLYHELK